jgi:hypothetical protein
MAFLLIIVFLFSGCINQNNNKNESEVTCLHYDIKIEIINVTNYTLQVPVLIGWNNFVDNIQIIDGKANYQIVSTKYNEALEIMSMGNISIISNENVSGGRHYDISLLNKYNWTVKIYCNKLPVNGFLKITNHLAYYVKNKATGDYDTTYYINSKLNNGWNDVRVHADSGGG